MPVTYNLIASNTLSSSAASVTFSAIPATYTDLVLRASIRNSNSSFTSSAQVTLNSSGTTYSSTFIYGTGSSAGSYRTSSATYWLFGDAINGNTSTSNTFSSVEMYLPNYTLSGSKVSSLIASLENNSATDWETSAQANLWTSGGATTSITITPTSTTIASGSSFFLYGIKNS